MRAWQQHSAQIIPYLESLAVLFAPTPLPRNLRRHLEGSLARHLRERHPDAALFYPSDNWTGALRKSLGETLKITADSPVRGLDSKIPV